MNEENSDHKTKTKINIEDLIIRANELKSHIDILSNVLNTYINRYREFQLTMETLRNLPEDGGRGYVVLDRLSTALIPAMVDKEWTSNILVNLGLNYYLKTSRDKAIELIGKKISETEKIMNDIQTKYKALLEEYTNIQRTLSKIYETLKQEKQ
ncbi:MAG: prefoldin domain-containing protein [Desulfurococcaceae archaeon]